MASSTPHTIILEHAVDTVKLIEGLGDEAIAPGEWLKQTATGYALQNVQGGSSQRLIAVENPYLDTTTTTTAAIDTDWTSGDTVRVFPPQSNDKVYSFLAAGENASINSALWHAGTASPGHLAVVGSGTPTLAQLGGLVGYATEAVNNSAGTVAVRVRVRVA